MPAPRSILLIACLALILSACGPAPSEPLPTEGVKALPQDLPTFTPQPSLTPAPTKEFLTPTSLFAATPTPILSLYTAMPGTEEAATPDDSLDILLYEDTGNIGVWIKEVMDGMALPYTYVIGSGALLKQLQTDTKWDLIMIAAENKTSVQGDLWELINQKVTFENTSLIVEMWFIDLIYEGKIKPLLTNCGVELSKHYNLKSAVPVYVIDPMHPIFNTPNAGFSVIKPAPYWDDQAVDFLRLLPNSPAQILAGGVEGDKADNGLIVSCFNGRMILQTFLNHDYPEATAKALWQNYISYMLLRK